MKTSYTLNTASIDYDSFEPEIEPTEEALREHYNINAYRYETPERIQARYLHFSADAFLQKVGEPKEDALREHFIANRARFVEAHQANNPQDDSEAEMPAVKFQDVRDLVSTDLRQAQANRLANEAAQNFAYELYNKSIPRESSAYTEALNATGLNLNPIEAFSTRETGARGLPVAMLDSAFALSDARYFSDPYPFDDGFAVLLYEARIPVALPPYEAVEEQVKADYAIEEKRRLFYEQGVALKAALEAELAAGVSFTDAATQLELEVEEFESFKLFEAPTALNRTALQAVANLEAGELSPMLQTGSSGLFVYLAERDVPEINPEDATLQQATNFLKYNSTMIRMNALASELVERGMPASDN